MTWTKIPDTPYELHPDGIVRRYKAGRLKYCRLGEFLSVSLYDHSGKRLPTRNINRLLSELHPSAPHIRRRDVARINGRIKELNDEARAPDEAPEKPELSKRKCAKCGKPTMGYWCAKHRAEKYAEGSAEYGSPLNEYQLPW